MKPTELAKKIGTSAIALCVASFAVVLPVSAQAPTGDPTGTGTTTETTGTTGTTGTAGTTTDDDDGFDWGLLGLLGLLGLAGLAGRKNDDETTRYRDPRTESTTAPPSRIDPNR
jgi:hypothetical protein